MGVGPILGVFGRRNATLFLHTIVLGAGGAIASQDAPADSGVVATKTAGEIGRYTLQFPKGYRKFHGGTAIVVGPDDAVYGAKTKGNNAILRDVDIDGGALDGTVELQFLNPSTDATNYIDAEVPDSLTIYLQVWVSQ